MEKLCLFSVKIIVVIYGLFFHSGVAGDNKPQFSAMYVFGDSLIDNGNNNFLMTAKAKANFPPYGIDFIFGPTGRFTNGKTIIDFLAEYIGLPYIPAYASPLTIGPAILSGVNYASAAGGILDQSGEALGGRFSLSKQVENFKKTRRQLEPFFRDDMSLKQYLANALAVLIMGSNDYINNYLVPSYPTRSKYNPDDYAILLINEYTKYILDLYDQGLRKFFIAGVGAIGCTPGQKTAAQSPPGKCADYSNDIIQPFNTRLKSLVDQLNATHFDATFIYASTYDAFLEILTHPDTYGLTEIEQACCGIGKNRAEKMCLPFSIPCSNRSVYAFWDSYHPSQTVHQILASVAYNGSSSLSYNYPLNLKQMALI